MLYSGALLIMGFILSLAGIAFAETAVALGHARIAVVQRNVLSANLDQAIGDALSLVNVAINGGAAMTGPFSPYSTTRPACANPTGVVCNNANVAESITWTTNASGGQSQTLGNVNVQTTWTGQVVESYAYATVSINLVNAASGATVAHRGGKLTIRVTNTPPTFANVDGFVDDAGNQLGASAEGQVGGRCNTSDPTCSSAALDSSAPGNSAADDGRLHAELLCKDPGFSTGQYSGNLCQPTADPTWTYRPDDSFTNQSTSNGNATGGFTK